MNIKSSFLASLVSSPKLSASERPESFIGQINPTKNTLSSSLPSVLSGGGIHALSPWTFDMKDLNCYLLLYTKAGCGKLLVNNQVFTLDASSFLFLDCSCRFRFDIAVEPWEYDILFITGDILSTYYKLLPEQTPAITSISPHSDIATNMEYLAHKRIWSTVSSQLIASDLLNHIITALLTSILQEDVTISQVPAHIENIREQFEQNYPEPYSLDALAEQYHISKYRLCREFKTAYGEPPLQYLNRLRIDIAKRLLLTTALRVHEVGSRVHRTSFSKGC